MREVAVVTSGWLVATIAAAGTLFVVGTLVF
jgi:hypothetical protein